ncbi:MAG: polymerase sigma-54 factor [Candidatus Atribacteria bacterium]|jgi:RNA polymerase sigma-54 factor|nr:polymerase sigma-54 factor [Candidatus Atribacteria bacterium]
MELKADLRLLQRPQLIPKMAQAVEMMALPLPQLEQKLQKLVEDNPLLEVREGSFCYSCGTQFSGYTTFCPKCGRYLKGKEDEEFSGKEFVEGGEKKNWKEMMKEEIFSFIELNREEKMILHFLIAHLDEDGFLRESQGKLAFLLGKKEDDLEEIIDKVRKEGFLGFAAYDTYDFLLLQMIQLKIIKKEEKEKTRREFISHPQKFQKLLQPYQDRIFFSPVQFFEASLGREAKELELPFSFLFPDAEILKVGENSFEVILTPSLYFQLTVNEEVLSFYRKRKKEVLEREKDFWQEKLREAREVVSCLNYRNQLLLRVLDYIVERESQFLLHGFHYFVPLTQKEVADGVGVSVSAVCQILKEKSICFPDGVVRSVKLFFDNSYPVKEMIKIILDNETPGHPLSDQEIARRLDREGFHIARRTCALYREEMGVLPSHLRRRLKER